MPVSSVQTPLFEHDGVRLCRFRCPPGHDRWARENRIVDGHNVAFAEVPVEILPADHPGRLADANVAVFYNHGDPYRRRLRHPRGDAANVFQFEAVHLTAALAPHFPDVDLECPLPFRFGTVRPETYLKQRLLLAQVAADGPHDPVEIVERAMEILDEVLTTAVDEHRRPRRPSSSSLSLSTQRDKVDAVRRLLFEHHSRRITLPDLASQVETSVFHLCRVFRRHTGQTVHGYLQQLRLRSALALLETDTPLAGLALDVGFSHQSHFTEAFRRQFGVPPGTYRRRLRGRDAVQC